MTMGTTYRAAGREIDRLFREGTLAGSSDGELLDRFASGKDGAAFEALVARHGGMVRRACRDLLGNDADADDACQATFLVLLGRAGSIRSGGSLAGWLHRVAVRTARRHRSGSARREAREARSARDRAGHPVDAADALALDELRWALQVEVDRLPDRYRRPVILCWLEGLSQAEASARLGWSEGSVRGRLARARARLRSGLVRRGLAPAAVAIAMGELAGAAAASATSSGLASFVASKAAALLLALGATLAVASLAGPPPSRAAGTPAPAPAPQVGPEAKAEAPGRSIVLRGRVVDPAGRPVPGARVYLIADWVADPVPLGVAVDGTFRAERPEKEFARNFSQGANFPGKTTAQVFATADGLGMGWIVLDPIDTSGKSKSAMKSEYDLTIRMVEDYPVSGRLVSPDGRPVAGVSVTLEAMDTPEGGDFAPVIADLRKRDLTHYYDYPGPRWIGPHGLARAGVIPPATTGADGRYRLAGVGRDRRAGLAAGGPGIAAWKWVSLTRDDLTDDVARAIREITPRPGTKAAEQAKVAWGARHEPLHGARAEVVIAPARTVAGTVRDARTGRPLPGVKLWVGTAETTNSQAPGVTDAEGRYRVERAEGLPRVLIRIAPENGHTYTNPVNPYLGTARELSGVGGLGEVVADFALDRGVIVSGRVVEEGTFLPMVARDKEMCPDFPRSGLIRYFPLAGNRAVAGTELGNHYRHLWPDRTPGEVVATLGPVGTFTVAVPPGPGVLLVEHWAPEPLGGFAMQGPRAEAFHRRFPYVALTRRVEDDGAPRVEGGDPWTLPGASGPIGLGEFIAYKVIDPPPIQDEVKGVTILVPRPPTRRFRLVDPEGNPVRGASVTGLAPKPVGAEVLDGDGAEVLALDPARSRALIALSPDGRFAARFEIRGDSAGPIVVRMEPAGTLTGRLVDPDGRPIPRVVPDLVYLDPANPDGWPLDVREDRPRVKTTPVDDDGRFRIVGLLPGLPARIGFTVAASQPFAQPTRYHPARLKNVTLAVGEAHDLGDVEARPDPR